MVLDEALVASIVEYRRIILLMNDFYATLVRNHKKDTVFPQTSLRRLLKETQSLPGSYIGV